MTEAICGHILDIIESDARTIRGGNAWTAGFGTVIRVEKAGEPLQGAVNLYDDTYEPSAEAYRPAVYIGSRGNAGTDDREMETISSTLIQYRVAKVPLIIVCSAQTKPAARKQCRQLQSNIECVLGDPKYIVQAGYWYDMDRPGNSGGGDMRQTAMQSATGQEAQGIAVYMVVMPIAVHYTFNPTIGIA